VLLILLYSTFFKRKAKRGILVGFIVILSGF